MRWDRLFADMEAQLEAAERADLDAEVADRTRRELARVRLADRLRVATDHAITCRVLGAGRVVGRVAGVGPDWLLVQEPTGREALTPLAAIVSVAGLGRRSAVPGQEGRVGGRLRLGLALRGIARDRSPVAVTLVDGSSLYGTIDRVGADFVDLAEHGVDEVRRVGDVRGVSTLPFGGLALVRRDEVGAAGGHG